MTTTTWKKSFFFSTPFLFPTRLKPLPSPPSIGARGNFLEGRAAVFPMEQEWSSIIREHRAYLAPFTPLRE